MPDLLIELLSEEIPARMQARAADDLKRLVTNGLVEAGLTYAGAVAHATPRRLALALEGLTEASPTTTEERRGPRTDAPEKAIEGFLRSTGLARDDLAVKDDRKGQVYVARITRPGRPAAEIVDEVLETTIRAFPWPKSMRWGDGTLRWVRPLRRILCVMTRDDGAEVVPLEIDGLVAGNVTEGHRFMSPGEIKVASFEDYAAKLKRAHVVLSAEERAEAIWHDATNRAFAAGLEVVEDKGLLAEVAGLVEWPVVLMGRIAGDYLDLPPEVLQTSMKEHQKFFSVRDRDGRITRFVTVANRETADDGATILDGNTRVLSARLADAKFFWENDLRVARAGMKGWLEALGNVTFHAKLGSQRDRIERIAALAREIAPAVGADPDEAKVAATFAKADLASEMVYEFPELQGAIGSYYTDHAGYEAEICAAVEEHYLPLGPSDSIPESPLSKAVALADKLDTLAAFWAIDEKPTGSRDPYALRRSALGVIRIVIGPPGTSLRLRELAVRKIAAFLYRDLRGGTSDLSVQDLDRLMAYRNEKRPDDIREDETQALELAYAKGDDLLAFLHDRLKVHLRDEGVRHDVIDACLTGDRTDDLADLVARARALNAMLATEDGADLIQLYRRAANILAQAEAADGVEYSFGADRKLAETDAERALFDAIAEARPRIDAAMASEDYPAAMTALAALRGPVDAFFEAVQVNAENAILRRNRLNLISEIVRAGTRIADLTRIAA
ncbi:glycine--tRNA ligase subunit beta [uncultured Jannaschia sp.]|uniref:glycine--tRNA ligase subunit beta n=1 Tax=uncultured Jannaschia sp. TaxID=293347 RepID=UPI00261B1075|nr:glycine--tRNA ligase subunit beta [uncultured Jannaschia sp.]